MGDFCFIEYQLENPLCSSEFDVFFVATATQSRTMHLNIAVFLGVAPIYLYEDPNVNVRENSKRILGPPCREVPKLCNPAEYRIPASESHEFLAAPNFNLGFDSSHLNLLASFKNL